MDGADTVTPFKTLNGILTGSFSCGGSWGSTSKSKTFIIPDGVTEFVAIATTQYGNSTASDRGKYSHCSISVPSYKSVKHLMNSHLNDHTFYDGQWIASIYQTNGKSQTITMKASNSGSMHYWMFGVIYNK